MVVRLRVVEIGERNVNLLRLGERLRLKLLLLSVRGSRPVVRAVGGLHCGCWGALEGLEPACQSCEGVFQVLGDEDL